MRDATLTLRDGRALAWCELGAPGGRPAVYLHGCPGSRLDLAGPVEQAFADAGVRLIAFDRPGFGGSSPRRGRRIPDVADDVAQLAEHVGLERFALLAISAGGPYALAAAAALGARVTHVVVASGVAPVDAPGLQAGMAGGTRLLYRLSRRAPFLVAAGFAQARRRALRDPQALLADFKRDGSPRDREVLGRPELGEHFVSTVLEATRQGGAATARDIRLWARPWGVDIAAIACPVVLIHGDEDRTAPIAGAEHLAGALADARLVRRPGEGHMLAFDDPAALAAALHAPGAGAGAT